MHTSFQQVFSPSYFGLNSIFSLIFPNKCAFCECEILDKRGIVCFGCESRINWSTPLAEEVKNQVLQGINLSNVDDVHSLFLFSKNGVEQSIIHRLKYQNSKQTGVILGKKLALSIKKSNKELQIDCLIPVPIYHSKKYDRGYNQALSIAKGISSILNIPTKNNLLRKKRKTKSQTKLSKEDRLKNVENSFVASAEFLNFKSIGIVDDVITTGATLGAICKEISSINESIKITIFTAGVARLE